MANIDMKAVLADLERDAAADARTPRTKLVCTLGPASRSVPMLEKLLRAGMNVARFNFSHGTHEYHQETLDSLRQAMHNTGIICAVMLDTKGPEIRTGFLKDGKPVKLTKGQEITVTTDYDIKGDSNMISMISRIIFSHCQKTCWTACEAHYVNVKGLYVVTVSKFCLCFCLSIVC
jgi:pyruvate kinase